eukprot:6356349-Alexandrium_andersonii.AAC.1
MPGLHSRCKQCDVSLRPQCRCFNTDHFGEDVARRHGRHPPPVFPASWRDVWSSVSYPSGSGSQPEGVAI